MSLENINNKAFEFFMNQKQKHSKLDGVEYSKLETQPYLTSKKLKTTEKKILFNLSLLRDNFSADNI